MMSYFVSKDAQNWDKCLLYALLAYRITPHTVTGYSPHYLMYGQELGLPIEDDLKVVIKKTNPGNYDEHVIDLAKKLKQVHEIERKTIMDKNILRDIKINEHRTENLN